MTTIAQVRGARGLLGWSQGRLATAAALSEPTVKRFETGVANVSQDAISKMRAALEKGGVVFVEENSHGPGVRLRKTAKRQPSAERKR
jgi:ribosome-binding protein aMBF1 (putative translation factor)